MVRAKVVNDCDEVIGGLCTGWGADPDNMDLKGKHLQNFDLKWVDLPAVDLSLVDIRWQIAAEWSEIAQWSQWRAYGKPTSLFGMVRSTTAYDLSPPQNGRPKCTPIVICRISNCHISATGHSIHFMFGSRVGFSESADRMTLFPVWSNPRWWPWRDMTWQKISTTAERRAMSPFTKLIMLLCCRFLMLEERGIALVCRLIACHMIISSTHLTELFECCFVIVIDCIHLIHSFVFYQVSIAFWQCSIKETLDLVRFHDFGERWKNTDKLLYLLVICFDALYVQKTWLCDRNRMETFKADVNFRRWPPREQRCSVAWFGDIIRDAYIVFSQ